MTLGEALEAMTTALEPLTMEIPGLQITGGYLNNPTPPSIDIYPDPSGFQVGAGFGVGSKKVYWIVRARVNVADNAAASQMLLRMLDTSDAASVEAALVQNEAAFIDNEGSVSGFIPYGDDMLGSEWRVAVFV